MLLGPFFMVGGTIFRSAYVIWFCQLAGAAMVMVSLFYLSGKLHEQTEEVVSMRELLSQREVDRTDLR
jgi:type VI protein secretion system component VasF